MAPSSSGLGHRAFIPVIMGSNPIGVTNSTSVDFCLSLYFLACIGLPPSSMFGILIPRVSRVKAWTCSILPRAFTMITLFS